MNSNLNYLADELGELERELAPHKAKIARVDVLKKLLRQAFTEKDASQAFTIVGERWTVQLGPKGVENTVNAAQLCALVGIEKALEYASFTLKALDLAAPEIRAAVVSTHLNGTRPLQLFASPEPTPEKKAAKKRAGK